MIKTKRKNLIFLSLISILFVAMSCLTVFSLNKKSSAENVKIITAFEGADKSTYSLTSASVNKLHGYPIAGGDSDPCGWGISATSQAFDTSKYSWGLSLSLSTNRYLFCTQTLTFANSYDVSLISKLTIEGFIESNRSLTGTGAGADYGAYYFVRPGETNATNNNSIKITGEIPTNLGSKFSISFSRDEFSKIAVDGKIVGFQVVGVDAVGAFIGDYGFLDLVNVFLETSETCTVYFDTNGGNEIEPQTVYYNETLSYVPIPTKKDMVFAGWVDKDNNEVDFSRPITNDRTYFATWEEPKTVSFNTDGGSLVVSQEIPYGKKAVSPEDPVKEGFVFAGWYLGENKFDFKTSICENITLVAKWLKNDVGLVTDFNNEKGFVSSVAKAYQINGYPKNGAMSPENWGVIGNAPTNGSKPATTNLYLSSIDNKTCVVFDLYSNQYNFFSKAVEIKNKLDITKISKLFIKVKITSNISALGGFSDENTNIFLSNLATENVKTSNSIVIGKDFSFNVWQTIEISGADLDKISNKGYFEGFQVSCLDIQKKNIGESAKLYVDAIYVQSNETCIVNYNSNGGTSVQNQTVVYGSIAKIPTQPTKQNVLFVSWYYDGTSTKVDFDKPIVSNSTYKARWAVERTVTFDSAGGSFVPSQIVLEGELANEPENPQYDCNVFKGWFIGNNLFDFNTPIETDIVLKAKWDIRYQGTVLDFDSNKEYSLQESKMTRIEGSLEGEKGWGKIGWLVYGPYRSPYEFVTFDYKTCLSYYVLFHSVVLPDNGLVFNTPIPYGSIESLSFNIYISSPNPKSASLWNDYGSSYTSIGSGFHIYSLNDTGATENTGIRVGKDFTFNSWQTITLDKTNGLDRLVENGYIKGFQLANFDLFGGDTSEARIYIDSVTITSKTTYNVVFDSNGGSVVESQQVPYGCLINADNCITTQTDYNFIGWFDNDGNIFDLSSPITKDLTLTALWLKETDPDIPEEEYVFDSSNPIIFEFDTNNCEFTNKKYLTEINGKSIEENYSITNNSEITGSIDSVRLSHNNSAFRFKMSSEQLTRSFAIKFSKRIKISTLRSYVSSVYLRFMYQCNSGNANETTLYLFGYTANGAKTTQGYKLNLKSVESSKWINLKLSIEDLKKIANDSGYIDGIQIVAIRTDNSSIEDYFYIDYLSHSILESEISTINFDSPECEDFELLNKNYIYLADGTNTTEGTGSLTHIIDYNQKDANGQYGIMSVIDKEENIEIVDLPIASNGKAYKFAIHAVAHQKSTNAIIYEKPLNIVDVDSITIKIYCHFNTKDSWEGNEIFLFPLNNPGWYETGFCITGVPQDKWVTITISGLRLERFAGINGLIEGFQIGTSITSYSNENFYIDDIDGNPTGYMYIDYIRAVEKYTVSFNEDIDNTKEFTVGAVDLKDYYYVPEKEGKVFCGWFLEDEQFNFGTTLTEDIVLTAKWADAESISKYQGLYVSSSNNRVMIFRDKTVDLSDMLEGYVVCGISDNILYVYHNYKIKQFNLSTTFIKLSDFCLISWDVGNELIYEYVTAGETIDSKSYQRNGFSFVKWVDQNNNDIVFPLKVNTDIIISSVWEMNEISDYSNSLGKYFNETNDDYIILKENNEAEVYTSKYVFDGKYYILDNNTIVFEYENDYCYGLYYNMGMIKLGEDYTTKTTESIPLLVVFEANGGSKIENIVVKYGSSVTKPSNPVKKGYIFKCWEYNGEEFDFSKSITSLTVLHAVWEIDQNYNSDMVSVYFNSNGGSSVAYVQVDFGEKIAAPTVPEKEGYVFVRWDYNGTAFDFNTLIVKDITLDAVWEEIYYVNFNTNGGNLIAPIMVVGRKITLPANPTRNGYEFKGWYYEDGTLFNVDAGIYETIELTAKWEKIIDQKDGPNKSKGCVRSIFSCSSSIMNFPLIMILISLIVSCLFTYHRRKQ